MKATDVSSLPAEVRAALVQEYTASIRKELGLPDGDVVAEIKKMQERDAEREKQAISAKITEMATTGDTAIKSDLVRETVIELVLSKNPKSIEEVKTVFTEVVSRDSIKKHLQSTLQEQMGPNQQTTMQTQQKESETGMKGSWFVLPGTKVL